MQTLERNQTKRGRCTVQRLAERAGTRKMPGSLPAPREKATQAPGTACVNAGELGVSVLSSIKCFLNAVPTSGPDGRRMPRGLGGPGPGGVSPRTGLVPDPKPPLHTLLTSIKLLALRVNVFHIKNILKQNAGHGNRATRVAPGALTAQPRLRVRAPPRAEKRSGRRE